MGLSAGVEKIGLRAILEDKDFQRGLAAYLKGVDKATGQTERAADKISKDTEKIGKSWEESGKKVGTAAAVMGAAMVALLTKFTLTAARTQELGIVLNVVGRNIGKNVKQMKAFEVGVKSMGITTQAARQSLIQMAQANIDLSHATDLARLAQDAAVIAGLDSSQAFNTLITGIQRGSLIVLRTMGLTVSWENAYKDFAETLGKTQSELTLQEKLTARVGEVMRAGANIAGTYEAAMGSAGKQMRSMKRYTEELQNQLGEHLLPVMGAGVSATTDFLKVMLDLPTPVKATIVQVGALAAVVTTLGGAALLAGPRLLGLLAAMAPLAIPVAAIAAIAGTVVYLTELEKAHRAEAGAILDSAASYSNYLYRLGEAEIGTYAMTESLYDMAKAAIEAGEAINLVEFQKQRDEAKSASEGVKALVDDWDLYGAELVGAEGESFNYRAEMQRMIGAFSDLRLKIAQNRDEVSLWAQDFGMQGIEGQNWVNTLIEIARAEEVRRTGIQNEIELMRTRLKLYDDEGKAIKQQTEVSQHYAERQRAAAKSLDELAIKAGLSYAKVYELSEVMQWSDEAVMKYGDDINIVGEEWSKLSEDLEYSIADLKSLHYEFGWGEKQIRDWAKSIEESEKAWNDAVDAWIRGVVDLKKIEDKLADVKSAFKDTLDGIYSDLSDSITDINAKYATMLPARTPDEMRIAMGVESWDEHARRMEALLDGIDSADEQHWLDQTTRWTESTKFMQLEGESQVEWLNWLLDQYEEGVLPDEFYDKQTAAWQRMEDEKKAIRDQAVADARASAAKQAAAAKKAAKAATAALKAQRAEIQFAIGLEVAEGPELEAWAEKHLGALAEHGDTAAEAIRLLNSGLLDDLPEAKKELEALAEIDLSTNLEDAVEGIGKVGEEGEKSGKTARMSFDNMAKEGKKKLKKIATAAEKTGSDMEKTWTDLKTHALEQIREIKSAYDQIKSKTITITVEWEGGGGPGGGGGTTVSQPTWQTGPGTIIPLQRGGPIAPGEIYTVGEAGPELFMSEEAGTIIPNSQFDDWARIVAAAMIQKAQPGRRFRKRHPESIYQRFIKNVLEGMSKIMGLAEDIAGVWEERMIPASVTLGRELAGVGSSFASMLEPMLEDQAKALSILGMYSEEWDRINKAVMDFRGVEQRLSYLQDQQDLIDTVIAAGLDARDVFAGVTFGVEADTAQLLQLVADHMKDAADAQNALITDTDTYIAQRERLYRIDQASAELDFLQTQLELMQTLSRLGDELGPQMKDAIGAMKLGLDADAGELVNFMDALVQAMLEQTRHSLGIASPSQEFEAVGREMGFGLTKGLEAEPIKPFAGAIGREMGPGLIKSLETEDIPKPFGAAISATSDLIKLWEKGAIPAAIKLGESVNKIGVSLINMLKERSEALATLGWEDVDLERITGATMRFEEAEQQLGYLKQQQELVDAVVAAGLDAREVFADITFGPDVDYVRLLEHVANWMEEAASAQGALVQDMDDYIKKAEASRLYELAKDNLSDTSKLLTLTGTLAKTWEDRLVPSAIRYGDSIRGIGSSLAGMVEEQREGLSMLGAYNGEWLRLHKAVATFEGAEKQLDYLALQRDLIDATIEAGLDVESIFAGIVFGPDVDAAELLQIVANRMQEAAAAQDGLIGGMDDYIKQRERLYEIEQASAEINFLQTQLELMHMVADLDLGDEMRSVFEGLTLGLEAEGGELLAFMDQLIKELLDNTKDQLGIDSPSKVYKQIGKDIRKGLEKGLAEGGPQPFLDMLSASDALLKAWEDRMVPAAIELGRSLSGIGSSLIGMLQDQAEGLSILGTYSEEWDRINKAVMDFRGTEKRLTYLQQQQDLIDAVVASGLDAAEIFEGITFGADADTVALLQIIAERMRAATDAQGALIQDTDAYIKRRERLYRIEQDSAELDFLQTQVDLMHMVATMAPELGSAIGDVFEGLTLGLEADGGQLILFMDQLLQTLLSNTRDQLGISSPSREYEMVGRNISQGLEAGIMAEAYRPLAATTYITNISTPVSFGDTTVNTPADMAAFENRVIRTVRRSATGRM